MVHPFRFGVKQDFSRKPPVFAVLADKRSGGGMECWGPNHAPALQFSTTPTCPSGAFGTEGCALRTEASSFRHPAGSNAYCSCRWEQILQVFHPFVASTIVGTPGKDAGRTGVGACHTPQMPTVTNTLLKIVDLRHPLGWLGNACRLYKILLRPIVP